MSYLYTTETCFDEVDIQQNDPSTKSLFGKLVQ